jgi:tetratricopeptide (TPR) repeat protein
MRTWLGVNDSERVRPIANPFAEYSTSKDASQTMILRTKKGDRSVELEIPGDPQHLSDFVLPVSPAFKNMDRNPAAASGDANTSIESDESYKTKTPSFSDREITRSFPQGLAEDENKRREIEQSLNLTQSEDDTLSESTPSYLASVDHIKQLYRAQRYEAGLLTIDELIRVYPTDPKLHEMRGTLLDRLGRRELALRSWNQALRFNPSNLSLKKFIERKQLRSVAGGP